MKRITIWTFGAIALSMALMRPDVQGAEPVPVGSAFAISTSGDDDETLSALAYNSVDNRFLVAWGQGPTFVPSGEEDDVMGQLVNPNGTLFRRPIAISTAMAEQIRPTVAYSPSDNRFLVAFRDRRNGTQDIFAQVVLRSGRLVGSNFAISTALGDESRPDLAYDPVNNRYLAVWEDSRNGPRDIFGQIIDTDGTLVGENFLISGAAGIQERAHAAYNAVSQRFLVVWADFRNHPISGADIHAQFVDPNGALDGESFSISSDAPGDQFRPHLAYDGVDDLFLVAWTDCRNDIANCMAHKGPGTDIFAQVVLGDGTLSGSNFPIAADPAAAFRSPVAFSPTDRVFLVVWTDGRNFETAENDIFMQAVNADGTLLGGNIPVVNAASDQLRGNVAYDTVDDKFLVTYTDHALGTADLFGQFVNLQ